MDKQSSIPHIATINAGSSSIKLALFTQDSAPQKVYEASIENIGQTNTRLTTNSHTDSIVVHDHNEAIDTILQQLQSIMAAPMISAVGHRIVHGGPRYAEIQPITQEVLATLHTLTTFDPIHMPIEIALVEEMRSRLPDAQHFACFDTAFHRDLPTPARLLPIPRTLTNEGIRRYGFHGLSYAYIIEELQRVEGLVAANGKVIIAHLGSGASLAALHNGKPIDTTMSMTPASGIPMSTRSGDLDPGLALYLATVHNYDAERFNHMVHFESGLLGISGTTADMKRLLKDEKTDSQAREAVEIFCYHVRKTIGAFAAALGGVTTIVFTGGIGERAPRIREEICRGLDFLGVVIDEHRNQGSERLISADGSGVGVHVIHTDEATTIAREITQYLKEKPGV